MKARATVVTATTPPVVTKRFSLVKGEIRKSTSAHVTRGKMEAVAFDGLRGFSEILTGLRQDQALCYGLPLSSPVELVTEEVWAKAGRPAGQQPRNNKTMTYPGGPGIFPLDYDPAAGAKALDQGGVVALLRGACPRLATVALLWWASAGSLIYKGDKQVVGLRGQRLYILVSDARDIPRAGEALQTHLWAAGHGYALVSKSGAILLRTHFDATIYQPSRLDFAAGAICDRPLEQRRGQPVLSPGDESPVDLSTAIPEPSPEARALAEAAKAAARAAVREEAQAIREKWITERAAEIEARTPGATTIPASEVARRAVERNELVGDWPLDVLVDDEWVKVTVLEVIDNPGRWHGLLTRDPLEPVYDNGRPVGKLFLYGSRPRLHSFAHGGQTFNLLRAPGRIELAKGREHDAVLQTLEVMRKAPEYFDFGDELVLADGGKTHGLNEHSLRHDLGGKIQYWRHHKVPNTETPIEVLENPPPSLCRALLALGGRRGLKPLDAVITAPTLRLDGSVLSAPGYDEQTRLLLDLQDEDLIPVPDAPTPDQTRAALEILSKPFSEFPFVGSVDRGVHLSALLTAVVRPTLPTAPGIGYDAPVQASGKTLLAKCVGALATGGLPDLWPHSSGDD